MSDSLIMSMYEEGRSVKEIAAAIDKSLSEVNNMLAKTDDTQTVQVVRQEKHIRDLRRVRALADKMTQKYLETLNAVIRASEMSAEDMKEISGANHNLMGQVSENFAESGKAIELRQAQGMKVVEVVFDNFARTQKLMATGLVDMIRFTNVYTDDEIRAVVAESDEAIDLSQLKSRKVGKYGITVQAASSSPTMRYANFMNILEIARMYPERVPAEAVIEQSNLSGKEKLAEQLVPVGTAISSQTSAVRNQKKEKLTMSQDFVNTLRSD